MTKQRVFRRRQQCVHVTAGGSAIILLLIAQVELPQFTLPNTAGLVGARGAAGTCGLGRFGALATRRSTLEEILGDGSMQILHGRRGCHAYYPWVSQGLQCSHPCSRVHCQQAVNEVLGQVRYTRPGLEAKDKH